jgi:hypothetical protein
MNEPEEPVGSEQSGAVTHKACADACWLCEFQGNRSAAEIVRLVMDSIPHISMQSLVAQCKYLLDNIERGSDVSTVEIHRHITQHMLHPRVKLAIQLQDMCQMQKEISKCCVVQDVESGERTLNPHAMRVYLSLCSQVASVYKLGEEKLTFNHTAVEK